MARDGYIGNRSFLRSIADLLRIEGVNRMPPEVDRSSVKIVQPLGPGAYSYALGEAVSGAIDMNGVSTLIRTVVGNDPGLSLKSENSDLEVRILGLRAVLTYAGAGIAADGGNPSEVQLWRKTGGSATNLRSIAHYRQAWVPDGVIASYIFELGGFNNLPAGVPAAQQSFGDRMDPPWVPAGSSFGITIARPLGGTYPAATVLNISTIWVETPRGIIPPI